MLLQPAREHTIPDHPRMMMPFTGHFVFHVRKSQPSNLSAHQNPQEKTMTLGIESWPETFVVYNSWIICLWALLYHGSMMVGVLQTHYL